MKKLFLRKEEKTEICQKTLPPALTLFSLFLYREKRDRERGFGFLAFSDLKNLFIFIAFKFLQQCIDNRAHVSEIPMEVHPLQSFPSSETGITVSLSLFFSILTVFGYVFCLLLYTFLFFCFLFVLVVNV